MLRRVVAVQFDRLSGTGRTRPLLLTCMDAKGAEVEVVAKLSACCDQKAVSLAHEVIAACLANDLGLPVPEPVLVGLPSAWIASVSNAEVRSALDASLPVAFGSLHVGSQYSIWKPETRLSPAMVSTALAVFVFDALIANPDRRVDNPNCLIKGEQIKIFDHEMAFTHNLVIPRLKPWRLGALRELTTPGRHIFRDKLRRQVLDFMPIRTAWSALSDSMVEGYAAALPAEWASATSDVADAIQTIKEVRDGMEECLDEIGRILT